MASAMDNINKAGDAVKDSLAGLGNVIQDMGKDIEQGIGAVSWPTQATDSTGTDMLDDIAGTVSSVGYTIDETNQWGWITLYVVTIVIAVLGNLLFVVAGLCTKRTRTTGYYLLLNLSVRDILVAALCVPFTLDSEIIAMKWNFGDIFCICYRYFYYCFLFFLPLTLLFLSWHLFVENCKWNFAGEEGVVPRPWPHTIFIPLIWFFSALFAVPTVFYSATRDVTEDFYRNELAARPNDALVCMHRGDDWYEGSDMFYIASFLLTYLLPVVLLFIPWCALLVQVCACCTRKLRSSEFWLSLITMLLVLIWEASRTPFELFNAHHILTEWQMIQLEPFIPGLSAESYKGVMKWAVYAPALLHPLVYFMLSPEARHGVYILFTRMCSCCCSKRARDAEVASDDEKGRMLNKDDGCDGANATGPHDSANVPLQSKQEDEM